VEIFREAVALIVRSMVLSAQAAGQKRLLSLQRAILTGDHAGELARLRGPEPSAAVGESNAQGPLR